MTTVWTSNGTSTGPIILPGAALPDNPIVEAGGHGLQIQIVGSSPNYEVSNINVIKDQPQVNNIQSFTSGAFGQVKPEQIWAFEAQALANQMAFCMAVANRLNETAQGLGHDQWVSSINALLPQMKDALVASGKLCDLVADTATN